MGRFVKSEVVDDGMNEGDLSKGALLFRFILWNQLANIHEAGKATQPTVEQGAVDTFSGSPLSLTSPSFSELDAVPVSCLTLWAVSRVRAEPVFPAKQKGPVIVHDSPDHCPANQSLASRALELPSPLGIGLCGVG